MTIRDMLDDGVIIQGVYEIITFVGDYAVMLAEGDSFDEEKHNIADEYLDMEVKYIYPKRDSKWCGCHIVIEVE